MFGNLSKSILAFLFGFMPIAIVAVPASAMDGDTYMALAITEDGRGFGVSGKKHTKKKAFAEAITQCRRKGSGCKVEIWATECLAYAAAKDGAWGTGWGDNRDAQTAALKNCRRHGNGCRMKVAVCN